MPRVTRRVTRRDVRALGVICVCGCAFATAGIGVEWIGRARDVCLSAW